MTFVLAWAFPASLIGPLLSVWLLIVLLVTLWIVWSYQGPAVIARWRAWHPPAVSWLSATVRRVATAVLPLPAEWSTPMLVAGVAGHSATPSDRRCARVVPARPYATGPLAQTLEPENVGATIGATPSASSGPPLVPDVGDIFGGPRPRDRARVLPFDPASVPPFPSSLPLSTSGAAAPEASPLPADGGEINGRQATGRPPLTAPDTSSTDGSVAAPSSAAAGPSVPPWPLTGAARLSIHVERIARELHLATVIAVYGAAAALDGTEFDALLPDARERYRLDAEVIVRSLDPYRHAAALVAAERHVPNFERGLRCYYATLIAPPVAPVRRSQ